MLDNLSGGRVILGIGRGLGRVEFGGFGVSMDESRRSVHRERAARARRAREGPRAARGPVLPAGAARPAARAVQVVPRSHVRVGGEPRVGEDHGRPAGRHHDRPAEAVGSGRSPSSTSTAPPTARPCGAEPPPPASAGWVFCDPDPGRARELGEQYVGRYYETVIDHYEFTSDHLATTKGYEYYGRLSGYLDKYGTVSGDQGVHRPPRHRHAEAVHRQDRRHPPHGRQRHVHGGVRVRRHGTRRVRAQPAAVRL